MPVLSTRLIESVKLHEGFRSRAYLDSVGVWTIGYGTNLQVIEVDKEQAEAWMVRDLQKVESALRVAFSWFKDLDEVRQEVLIEMGYNLGVKRLQGFYLTLDAIKAGLYVKAAIEMLDSKWARQVGQRAKTLAERMRHGH